MSEWVTGLDVAFSRVSRQWCRDRRAEGYRVFVQDLWTGGYENNAQLYKVAGPNLHDAHMGGLIPVGYVNASPWFNAGVSVNESMNNAGAMWRALKVVACDVEINGLTEWEIGQTCGRLEEAGKKVPIYSAAWYWHSIGNPQWPWLKDHKIWEAYYDRDPDIDFPYRRFGPWELADVIGEQYQGTTNIDGVDVDLNVFDLSYFQEEDDMADDWHARRWPSGLLREAAGYCQVAAGLCDHAWSDDEYVELWSAILDAQGKLQKAREVLHDPPGLGSETGNKTFGVF